MAAVPRGRRAAAAAKRRRRRAAPAHTQSRVVFSVKSDAHRMVGELRKRDTKRHVRPDWLERCNHAALVLAVAPGGGGRGDGPTAQQ